MYIYIDRLPSQAKQLAGKEKMSSESFCLAAQIRFDSKWLKTDLQVRTPQCLYLMVM